LNSPLPIDSLSLLPPLAAMSVNLNSNKVPFFSVITPVLNGAVYLNAYIHTLRQQTFDSWEAIVIDDGSTDGCFALLAEQTDDDPRFRLIRNEVGKDFAGPYHARNVGISNARGIFICFLDIDDCWLPNKLAFQRLLLLKNPTLDLVYSAYLRAPHANPCNASLRIPPPSLFVKTWIKIANPVPMLTACVRRSLLANIRFKPMYHEDYIFWHDVTMKLASNRMYCAYQPLAVYSVNPRSLSGNKLKSVSWIFKCYRVMGYSRVNSLAALAIRALLQSLFLASDLVFRRNYSLDSFDRNPPL
jgi:teichuronic acid biosynthesis glycosyltransferase TuaG